VAPSSFPPGQEGADPALQPALPRERLFELADADHVVRVVQGGPGRPTDRREDRGAAL